MFARVRAVWPLALLALLAAGCGGAGPQFGTVSGTVTVNGKPADNVRVEFHPDAVQGTTAGPSSVATTDADGRFTLAYTTPASSGTGAVVGKHKVVLQDLRLSESETGRGVPIRFGPDYGAVMTTPLGKEVKAGDQTIDITLP